MRIAGNRVCGMQKCTKIDEVKVGKKTQLD